MEEQTIEYCLLAVLGEPVEVVAGKDLAPQLMPHHVVLTLPQALELVRQQGMAQWPVHVFHSRQGFPLALCHGGSREYGYHEILLVLRLCKKEV